MAGSRRVSFGEGPSLEPRARVPLRVRPVWYLSSVSSRRNAASRRTGAGGGFVRGSISSARPAAQHIVGARMSKEMNGETHPYVELSPLKATARNGKLRPGETEGLVSQPARDRAETPQRLFLVKRDGGSQRSPLGLVRRPHVLTYFL